MTAMFAQVAQLIQGALLPENRWTLLLIAAIGLGGFAAVRGKLTESWVLIPLLALIIWYAMYRWLDLRARELRRQPRLSSIASRPSDRRAWLVERG